MEARAMEGMRYDEFGNPIFRVIDVPLPGPERIPRGLPDSHIPKFRHLVRQFELLSDLWDVQLGNEIHRTPWNLQAASAFWRENLPDTFEGRRFGYTENWIEDAMRKTIIQILGMRRAARRARQKARLDAYRNKCAQREQQNRMEEPKDVERGRSLENSKNTPVSHSDAGSSKSERRDNSIAKGPSCRLALRPTQNLTEDEDSTNSREPSPLKTPPPTEIEGDGDDSEGAVTEEDESVSGPVLLSKI